MIFLGKKAVRSILNRSTKQAKILQLATSQLESWPGMKGDQSRIDRILDDLKLIVDDLANAGAVESSQIILAEATTLLLQKHNEIQIIYDQFIFDSLVRNAEVWVSDYMNVYEHFHDYLGVDEHRLTLIMTHLNNQGYDFEKWSMCGPGFKRYCHE